MTKKDYILIAAALRAAREGQDTDAQTTITHVARRVGAELTSTNPRFDLSRFLKACES